MMEWENAQQQDEAARWEQIAQILQAAKNRPLAPDEIDVLSWETGYMQQRPRL
jgi:hypothetical protein